MFVHYLNVGPTCVFNGVCILMRAHELCMLTYCYVIVQSPLLQCIMLPVWRQPAIDHAISVEHQIAY